MVEFSILRRLRRSVVNSALFCLCSIYGAGGARFFCWWLHVEYSACGVFNRLQRKNREVPGHIYGVFLCRSPIAWKASRRLEWGEVRRPPPHGYPLPIALFAQRLLWQRRYQTQHIAQNYVKYLKKKKNRVY